MMRSKTWLLALVLGLCNPLAWAFPDKPVRIVVPYPAGGPVDSVARIVGERLASTWGKPVIVENRPGASGAIGTESVINAPADGSVLLFHSPIMLSTELVRPSVRYRSTRDFRAVSMVFSSPVFFMGGNEVTRGELKEVMAWAIANPGQLSYGSHGEGTTAHYMGERLKRLSGADITHIPFAGDAPIMTALMGGHVRTGFLSGAGARRAVDTGKVRVLAVASASRTALMPEVPTFSEQGFRGFERESWGMLMAPAATPAAVIDEIAREVDRIVRLPDVQQRLAAMGLGAKGGTAAFAQQELQADFAYWGKLVEEFGVLGK